MKKWCFIALMGMGLIGCGPRNSEGHLEGSLVVGNIINGSLITAENIYSRQTVGIYNLSDRSICTGAIIGEDLILTAAHCVTGAKISEIEIKFDVAFYDAAFTYHAKNIKVHESYSRINMRNDLALVLLDKKIPANFRALDLEDSRSLSLEKDDEVTSLGFGVRETKELSGAKFLRMAQIPVKKFASDVEFIVLDQTKGVGICFGDSGGPSFILKEGKPILVGIASSVEPTFFGGKKSGCTNAARLSNPNYFYDWIMAEKSKI